MSVQLGNLERQFFAYAQLRKKNILRIGELQNILSLSAKSERDLFYRLARKGLIARVRRNLYLVPDRLPMGDRWTPDEALALSALMQEVQGRYQVCGPNAFNRYGFDEQMPTLIYAYNNRLSETSTIGSVVIILIKVADDRLGDVEDTSQEGKTGLVYSSRTRTLVDAVYDWNRFDSLPRAYSWIRQDLSSKRTKISDLVDCTLRFGNQGTIRRIGFLLDKLEVNSFLLNKLQNGLRNSKSIIPFVPGPNRGKISRRWGVIDNESNRKDAAS